MAGAIGSAAAQGMAGKMIAYDDLEWAPMAEGSPVMAVTLWGDETTGPYGALLKLPPGTEVPLHAHTGDYSGINLQGTWRHYFDDGEDLELPPGSYVFQPGKALHGDVCIGDQECILFVRQDVGRDYIPKE